MEFKTGVQLVVLDLPTFEEAKELFGGGFWEQGRDHWFRTLQSWEEYMELRKTLPGKILGVTFYFRWVLYEQGGGGKAAIATSPQGGKLKPRFVVRDAVPCSIQAVFSGMNLVQISGEVRGGTVYGKVEQMYVVNNFDLVRRNKFTFSIENSSNADATKYSPFEEAIKALISKCRCLHCTHIHYAIVD